VSGVLPVTLEDATKTTQAFLMSGKEYVCLMQLHDDIEKSRITNVIKDFIGEIYQKPPLRSSVKRILRKRTIYEINILEIENRCVLFKVACEAGTYIRKLCSDVGEVIGSGAHMRELRRTRAGPFTENEGIVSLYELLDASLTYQEDDDERHLRNVILPVEKAFEYMPKIFIKDSAVNAICHGADLAAPGIVKLNSKINQGDIVALFTLKKEIIAIAKALFNSQKIFENKFGLMAKTSRVIMPIDTYPKLWGKR